MAKGTTHKTIGIVLSTVPRYSETFFRNKIKGLQANGFEVVIFADYKTEEDQNFPCEVIVAPNFSRHASYNVLISFWVLLKCLLRYPKQSRRHLKLDKKDGFSTSKRIKRLLLNQFLFTKQLDWIHFGFGMLAEGREHVANAIKAQMAVSFRGFDLYLSPLKHPDCYNLLFKMPVKYHVLSNEMKQDLSGYGIDDQHITVITPAINTDFFTSDGVIIQNQKPISFITVARLHWKKGLVYTLEALAILKAQGLNFQYTIVGEGEQLERLKFAVYQLSLEDEVTFKGKLKQDKVKDLLAKSDMYLQYSIQEGFCNAVLEAQSMGLMTIVSNAEGLSENVQDNKSGWVVPKRQPKLLARKIMEVIELTGPEKDRVRKYAKSRVRNEFNLPKQNQEFKAFYTE